MSKLTELLTELQVELDKANPVATKNRKGTTTQILEAVHDHELTLAEKLVLVTIYDVEIISTREVYSLTGISQPTMQKFLRKLLKLNLIRKVQNGVYSRELNIY